VASDRLVSLTGTFNLDVQPLTLPNRRGWASLVTGTRTVCTNVSSIFQLSHMMQVIQAMSPWRHESMFADYIAEQSPLRSKSYMNPLGSPITQDVRREHISILGNIQDSLQRLQPYLSLNRHEQEGRWVDQLRGYIERLKAAPAPQTAEEQFSQLYALRKWLFWVPISLLAAKRTDATVLVVLGHFYATALALEPMFPDVASAFVSNLALGPLEEIILIVQGYQSPNYDDRTQSVSYLIQYPNDLATAYRARRDWSRQQAGEGSPIQQSAYGLESLNLDLQNQIAQYSYGQSLSPGFAPSPLSFFPTPGLSSGQTSPYLEVPRSAVEFVGSSSYASPLGSPATVPPPYSVPEEHAFNFGMPMYHPSGFVPPLSTTIWT
jgi:hypothetical protein